MRLWSYQIIKYLPRKHLSGQWRECCAISSMISTEDNIDLNKINHTTINRIKEYPLEHFALYTELVRRECIRREWKRIKHLSDLNLNVDFEKLLSNCNICEDEDKCIITINGEKLYGNWHNNRYLNQCFHMFEEKYDTKQIKDDEWIPLRDSILKIFSIIE